MKAAKQSKADIEPVVAELLALKAKYESTVGIPFGGAPVINKESNKVREVENPNEKKSDSISKKKRSETEAKSNDAAVDNLITPRAVDYSAWYNDVISVSDMVDQSPVRGCMVIKPWGMGVWDLLRAELDERIRESGTQNAYFPLFIPKSFLSKEAEHVDGFAKECAVVTHHRLCKSPDGKELIADPDAKLEEPLIVRPTSETVIWNMFGKWISSYRDLPLKINQWANVVRWELRTRPFLRTTEFLWQEGHTAHASAEDAIATAKESLDMYASVCEDMLAIPTVKGEKSPSERFAGAANTYTIEALMQNGWALQSGTSHFLGQNFARAFDVFFQTETGERELVWATSWGVSTRLIGAMIMTHSDDKGLVLPPAVAPLQVVIVPITKGTGPEHDELMRSVNEIVKSFKSQKIRVKVDDRQNTRPGAKYFEWERKGVPIRLEIGPRDLKANSVTMVTRPTGEKKSISIDNLVNDIKSSLSEIHSHLLQQAQDRLTKKTFRVESYQEMKGMMMNEDDDESKEQDQQLQRSTIGFYLVPWKCDAKNEEAIKQDCKATIRCYPLELNQVPPAAGVKCFYSGEQATHMAIFA
eukprot:CAMPEP_0170074708 /NCGR_PEP_ID=MMETSP0019_2-20121128/11963_1 /TAXON_ID=98059 /ORGANISM="Dinobryon sp., Strain UTEXLB2267" /LENGTH=585 /DNA_ID=CAMNT_0010285183 /DNA_START=192 /DNA_END=1945 /DNA_ORIENTATION=-